MKKFFVLITSLLFFSSNFAQGGFIAKKVRIGVTINPFFSYRTLSAPSNFQEVVDSLNTRSSAQAGYSTGLSLVVGLGKRFNIETGVLYTDRGSNIKDINFTNSSGNVIGTAKQKFHDNYIDIPIKFNLNILNKRLRLFVSGGLSANVFLFKKIKTEVEYFNGTNSTTTTNNASNNNKVNLSALAGIGIEYHTLKVMSFRIEPLFSYALLSSTSGNVSNKPYSVGVNFGMFFGF